MIGDPESPIGINKLLRKLPCILRALLPQETNSGVYLFPLQRRHHTS